MDAITTIAIAGAAGGLIKSLIEQQGAVALPRIERAQQPQCLQGYHLRSLQKKRS